MSKGGRILYIIDSLHIGGAERLLVDVINYACEASLFESVAVVTINHNGGELLNSLNQKVDFYFVRFTAKNFVKASCKLTRVLKDRNVTHVHAHLYNSIIASRLYRVRGIKYYFTYHNLEYSPENRFYSPIRIWFDRMTLRASDTCFYVSKEVKRIVQKSRKKTSQFERTLYNFCNKSFKFSYSYSSVQSLNLIAIGNLKSVKNYGYLIEVFKNLKDFPIYLDIYGEGEERGYLEQKISKYGIENVFLKGATKISSELLSKYDAFVMCSISEGMPVSLIEAITTGLPSYLPMHLPVMKEVAGTTADYFDISNIEDLQQRLDYTLKNKSVLYDRSQKTRQISGKYTLEVHMEKLLDCYGLN